MTRSDQISAACFFLVLGLVGVLYALESPIFGGLGSRSGNPRPYVPIRRERVVKAAFSVAVIAFGLALLVRAFY